MFSTVLSLRLPCIPPKKIRRLLDKYFLDLFDFSTQSSAEDCRFSDATTQVSSELREALEIGEPVVSSRNKRKIQQQITLLRRLIDVRQFTRQNTGLGGLGVYCK